MITVIGGGKKSSISAPLEGTAAKTKIDKKAEETPRPLEKKRQTNEEIIHRLSLGEWAQWDGLNISVQRYEETSKCRGYGDDPAEGAKLVYVWIVVHNVSSDVVELPSFFVNLSGIDKDSHWFGGTVCRYDEEALGNACWKGHGNLYPEAACKGWELFEVPEKMVLDGRLIKISAYEPGKVTEIGEWQLGQ